jgi:hypothetical protein
MYYVQLFGLQAPVGGSSTKEVVVVDVLRGGA